MSRLYLPSLAAAFSGMARSSPSGRPHVGGREGIAVGVYLIVLLLVGIGVVGARHGLVGGRVRGRDVPVVDPYVTATLADGPKRVALTVVSDMVDARQLAVDRHGQVRPLQVGDTVTDPLRQAVLRGFDGQPQLRAQALLARA